MRPGSDADGRERTRHDGYAASGRDGRPGHGGGRGASEGTADRSAPRFGRRSTGRLPTLASVTAVAGGLSIAGTLLGTYGIGRLAPTPTDAAPALRTAFTGDVAGHLLAAAIGLQVVRDLSIVLGGVAIVLGCWVAVAGAVRIAGRR